MSQIPASALSSDPSLSHLLPPTSPYHPCNTTATYNSAEPWRWTRRLLRGGKHKLGHAFQSFACHFPNTGTFCAIPFYSWKSPGRYNGSGTGGASNEIFRLKMGTEVRVPLSLRDLGNPRWPQGRCGHDKFWYRRKKSALNKIYSAALISTEKSFRPSLNHFPKSQFVHS